MTSFRAQTPAELGAALLLSVHSNLPVCKPVDSFSASRRAKTGEATMANITKTDLTALVAEQTELSSADAKRAVEAVFDIVSARVAAGDEVAVAGFGKFTVAERSARQGRNPQTGETIDIAASKAPKFSAASAFKSAVKG
jgi:DNA-binding protein HU-beta